MLDLGFWQWLGCDFIVISLFRLKMTEGVSVSPLFNSRRLVPSSNPHYHISKANIPDLNVWMMWCQYFTPALFLHPFVQLVPYSPSHTCLVCSAPQREPGQVPSDLLSCYSDHHHDRPPRHESKWSITGLSRVRNSKSLINSRVQLGTVSKKKVNGIFY